MADHVDCIKMMALGRSFVIGTLYNYVEDFAIPNARLWDPDDVSRLSVVSTERKETVKVHSMSCALQTTEKEDHSSWLSELDDHSAMSLTAGFFRSPFTGAWQYISDRARSSSRGPEVAIRCHSSSKKVSIDPRSQLEIICRPERIIKNKATHVVVAVKFGLEAFCVFQNPEVSTTNDAEASVSEKMFDYANFFAKGLSDGRKKLELDHDKEGDEEDGGHDLVPADLQCILYKDVLGVKKGHQSWTSNNVAEQYEACRKILDHQVNKAVPLKIWLYPLAKLMPTETGIIQLPENKIDVSRHLVIKCQLMWNQWQHIRMETDAIKTEISQRSTVQRCWIPLAVSKRVNDFDKCLNEFMSAMQQAFYEWTISIRRGGEPEEKMEEMVAAVERKSPFIPEELENWLIDHRKQLKTLKTLSQLPGVHLVTEFKQLEKEIKNVSHNVLAVVLHLPSISEQLDTNVQELRSYVDAFTKSHPAHPAERIREGKVHHHRSAADRRFISVAQEFSDWVTKNNSDISSVRYIIFYNHQPICGAAELPFLRLYDSSFESNVNFTIPNAPGPVTVEKNYRGVITLSWTTEEEVEEPNYLLQYRNIDGSGERWDSIQHHSEGITINYLKPEESYVFRVAAVTPGGRSPFSPVSFEVTIDPVCSPPAGLQCRYVTDNSITISWDHAEIEEEDGSEDVVSTSDFEDGSICNRMLGSKDSEQHVKEIKNKKPVISCYLIDCWMAGNQDSSFIQRSTTETTITLEPLELGTTYCIQVRAVCNDGAGSSFYSPATPILEAETLEEAERAAHIVRRVSKKCPVGPGIDAYRLPLKKRHGTKTQGVGHYVFGEPSYLALAGKRRQRTILMLGATGSGKSTLINAMVNYVLGVEWDDDFRFKLIDEPADKSQAHSQTDLVTTYDLYEMKGSRLNYSLTVVDTPGFGDTRGLEKDKKIMQQIQDYFQCRHGIQQLEAVCFVVQSSLPRLTATQKYIFDSILSIFGQDIKDNIRLMVTFSDGALPPVLGAVKEAGIPSPIDPSTGLPLHHKFNNSIFFTSNKGDRQTNEFNRTYFDMAVGGFDKFFDDLGVMESKSLTLTREVLEERKRLEALVEGLQMKTEMKLTRVDELEKIKKILKENEDQMDANQAFEFETLVPKSTDISGTGQFTTNCQNCRTTCHFPCRQAHDNGKHRCSVMDRTSGNCMICKCPWNVHFNQKYRYEMVKEKIQRSSDAIRQQYQGAVSEALTNEQLLARIEKEIKKHESQLMELMQATYPCIQRLDEIALRPHSFSTPDYIDLMIAAEKQEHRPGYQQRIVTLHKLREMADITAKLIRDGQPVVSIPSREDHIQSKNSKSSLSLLNSKIVCEKQNFPKVNMAEVKCGKGFSAYNCKRCKKTCEKPAKIINFEKKMCKDRYCNCPPAAHVYQHFSLLKIKEKVTTPLLDMKAIYESVGKCPVTPAQPGKVNAGSCGRGRGFLLAMDSTGSPGESTYGRGETSSRSAQNYSGSSKIPSAGPGTPSAIDPRCQSKMSVTNSRVSDPASTTSFSSQRKTEVTKDGGGAGRGRGTVCGVASKWQENSVTPAQQEKVNLGSCGRGRGMLLNLLAMGSTGSPRESTHSGRGETSPRSESQNYSGSSASGSGNRTDPRCQSKISETNGRVSDQSQNFHKFSNMLENINGKDLKSTREVIQRRQQLEQSLKDIEMELDGAVSTIEDIEKIRRELQECGRNMEANKNFVMEKTEVRNVIMPCDKGFSAYNCEKCKKTCEKPAKIINFEKKMCKDSLCNCPSSAHVYQHFSLVKTTVKVKTTLLDMKAEYESNHNRKLKTEDIMASCLDDLTMAKGKVLSLLEKIGVDAKSLDSTALRSNALSPAEYLSLMMSRVLEEQKPGYLTRLQTLTELQQSLDFPAVPAAKKDKCPVTPTAQPGKVNAGSCGRGRGFLLAMGSTGSPGESTNSGRGETSSKLNQNYSGASASGSGTDPRCQSKMSGTNIRVSDPASTSSSSTTRKTEETKAGGETGHGLGRGRGIAPKWQFPHSSHFKDGRLIGYFSCEPENYYNNLSGKAHPKPCQKKEEDGQKPDVTSKGNANEPLSSEEETEQRAQQPKKAESLFWKVLNFFSRSPK